MPTGFAAHWSRRAIVLIAAWLVVLQALLAGVAIAQAGAARGCRSDRGRRHLPRIGRRAVPTTRPAPETGKVRHLCCAYCMSAAPAVPPPAVPDALQPRPIARLVAYSGFTSVARASGRARGPIAGASSAGMNA